MGWFSKPKAYLGVDLGAGGVKMVELRMEKHRPVLNTYGLAKGDMDFADVFHFTENKDGGIQEKAAADAKTSPEQLLYQSEGKVDYYASVIKEVVAQSRAVSRSAVVSLPVSAVFHVVVTMPTVKKEEFMPILQAEIKKLLARPIEEMVLDYQVVNGSKDAKSQKVLVNAVPRALVAFYSKIFQRAGVALDSLEPESAALARSLVGKDESVSMVIDMGAGRTNFFIVDHGVPVTHHSIELGGNRINTVLKNALGVEDSLLEQVKRDLSYYLPNAPGELPGAKFLEIISPVLSPITKEIGYSFDLYLNQSGNEGKRPEKIILSGGAALLPYLSDYLAEQFKMKCYIGDPWSRVVHQDGLRPVLRAIGPRMAVSIGLALRKVI